MITAQDVAEDAIRAFPWHDYRFHEVAETLRDPDCQDWVKDLAVAVLRAVLLNINYGSSIQVNDTIGTAGYE